MKSTGNATTVLNIVTSSKLREGAGGEGATGKSDVHLCVRVCVRVCGVLSMQLCGVCVCARMVFECVFVCTLCQFHTKRMPTLNPKP